MKKSLLLTVAALTAVSMSAQTDVTPKNWKFYDMEAGTSAYENNIFWEEWGSTDWGLRTSTDFVNNVGEDGGIVYAAGTNLDGSAGSNNYANIDEANRAAMKSVYEAATIVDAGRNGTEKENILCFIASGTDKTFPGGTKSPVSMYSAAFFWYTGKNLQLDKDYRLTFEFRAITDNSVAGGVDLGVNGADYYGIDTENGYTFKQDVQAGLKDRWCKIMIDFHVTNPNDATNVFPLVIKWYFNSLLEQGVTLFRSPKLEIIDAIEYAGGKFTASDFSDVTLEEETSVNEINAQNDVIIATANGTINVIDANAPIEVYNIAGAKVATVAAPSAVEAIDLDMNGVFVVKVGDKVQKVIL